MTVPRHRSKISQRQAKTLFRHKPRVSQRHAGTLTRHRTLEAFRDRLRLHPDTGLALPRDTLGLPETLC